MQPQGEGSALVMIYLNLNIDHSPSTLGALVEAVKMLHMSPLFCVCVRWLMRHANTTQDIVMKVNRRVEDALQRADILIGVAPATLLFDLAGLHKSDQRPLSARFSVGVSKQFGADSLWMQTPAARGHLGPQVTLIRPCNMRQPARADRGGDWQDQVDAPRPVGAAWRRCTLGPLGWPSAGTADDGRCAPLALLEAGGPHHDTSRYAQSPDCLWCAA